MSADIGLIGLAVMGQNLVLNMNDHGFVVSVFNRTVSKVHDFLANEAKGTKVIGNDTVEAFVLSLKSPRKIILLVKAGSAVDDFIAKLVPLLSKGDIIIDGGNSDYKDSERRFSSLQENGLLFVGSGVSGGEEGARYGPSLMPGGHPDAWQHIKEIFQTVSAKAGNNEPCCDWCGSGGAGHFVKMVHNGIEYGDMQLIAEAYHILREVLHCSYEEMSTIFKSWNTGDLDSFLISITADILAFKDTDGSALVDKILDKAGQKGTGRWTVENGLELGCPITLIAESVFSRNLSALKGERIEAEKSLCGPCAKPAPMSAEEKAAFIEDIGKAIYASKLVSYAQGFMMFQQAKREYSWKLNLGSIANMWRGGCIIRSRFLGDIKLAFDKQPDLQSLLIAPYFADVIKKCQMSWRRVVSRSVLEGVPVPAISSALAFYDGYRSSRLPANLIQAQRDYFGAHQYETLGNPGVFVHTNWTGKGGTTASSTYLA